MGHGLSRTRRDRGASVADERPRPGERVAHVRRGQPRPGPPGVVEPERGHPTEDGCRET
jgi:hypothetical protein